LGQRDYAEVWALQRELRGQRQRGEVPDLVLTVEHGPVLTAGRRARPEHLLLDTRALHLRGVAVHWIERGGDWTWHGPGQLVAYPIVSLPARGLRIPDFVAALEGAMRRVAERIAEGEVEFVRQPEHPGLWARRDGMVRKVGAVGVHVERGVTAHGLALNLDPHPWGFDFIRPCGLDAQFTTSLARLLGRAVPAVADAAPWLADALQDELLDRT
jgi:lipoate-protein ligase B